MKKHLFYLKILFLISVFVLPKNLKYFFFNRIGLHHTFATCGLETRESGTQYIMDEFQPHGAFAEHTWCPCNRVMSAYFLQ